MIIKEGALLLAAVACWLGCGAALGVRPQGLILVVGAILSVLGAGLWLRRRQVLWWFLALTTAAFVITGFRWRTLEGRMKRLTEGPFEASCVALEYPAPISDLAAPESEPVRVRFLAEIVSESQSAHPLFKNTRLFIQTSHAQPIQPGDVLKISGQLTLFPEKLWEGDFDARTLYWRQGIAGRVVVSEGRLAVDDAASRGVGLGRRVWFSLLRFRHQLAQHILMHASSSALRPAAAVAAAIITGERAQLDALWQSRFSRAGIIHLLSVSGLHVSAVGLIFYLFFRALSGLFLTRLSFPARKIAAAAAIPFVLIYVLLSGADIPALRSACAVAFIFGAYCLGQLAQGRRAWSWALLVTLFFDPLSALSPTLLFSFGTVWALEAWTRTEFHTDARTLFSKISQHTANLLKSACMAFAFSAPLSACFFHTVPVSGIVTNLLAVPLSNLLIVPVGLLWTLATLVGLPCDRLLDVAIWATQKLCWLSEVGSQWGSYDLYFEWYDAALALILLALRFSSPSRVHFRWPKRLLLFTLMLSLSYPWLRRHGARGLEIHFLPVGQGDSAVLFTPKGGVVLIDGGGAVVGSADPGERVIRPFLLSHGVRRIDHIILTHAHPDHYLGLHAVVHNFSVGHFWFNGPEATEDSFKALMAALSEKNIPVTPVDSEHLPNIAGIRLSHLHPVPLTDQNLPTDERFFDEFGLNDNSLVLKIGFRNHDILMTGDIERWAEEWMLQHLPPAALKADILKVAHHGSRTSTTPLFLQRVQPDIAVISSGRRNRFGHPHPEILSRIERHGVRIFRTDQGLVSAYLWPCTARDACVRMEIFKDF